jgi:uncharacterized membrane protein
MENSKSYESRLNNWSSLIFKLGIAISSALIFIGLILIIITGGQNIQPLISLNRIPATIVLSVGILLLLLTPIIQVIVAIGLFSRAKNRLFLGISLAVFCLAAISLAIVLT